MSFLLRDFRDFENANEYYEEFCTWAQAAQSGLPDPITVEIGVPLKKPINREAFNTIIDKMADLVPYEEKSEFFSSYPFVKDILLKRLQDSPHLKSAPTVFWGLYPFQRSESSEYIVAICYGSNSLPSRFTTIKGRRGNNRANTSIDQFTNYLKQRWILEQKSYPTNDARTLLKNPKHLSQWQVYSIDKKITKKHTEGYRTITAFRDPKLPQLCVRCGEPHPLVREILKRTLTKKVGEQVRHGVWNYTKKTIQFNFRICETCNQKDRVLTPVWRRIKTIKLLTIAVTGLVFAVPFLILYSDNSGFLFSLTCFGLTTAISAIWFGKNLQDRLVTRFKQQVPDYIDDHSFSEWEHMPVKYQIAWRKYESRPRKNPEISPNRIEYIFRNGTYGRAFAEQNFTQTLPTKQFEAEQSSGV